MLRPRGKLAAFRVPRLSGRQEAHASTAGTSLGLSGPAIREEKAPVSLRLYLPGRSSKRPDPFRSGGSLSAVAEVQALAGLERTNRGDWIRTSDLQTPSLTRYPGCATPRLPSRCPEAPPGRATTMAQFVSPFNADRTKSIPGRPKTPDGFRGPRGSVDSVRWLSSSRLKRGRFPGPSLGRPLFPRIYFSEVSSFRK